ncbi:MAG: hypothetical protein ABR599_06415, partial [Gemmatimonadota bacterium]
MLLAASLTLRLSALGRTAFDPDEFLHLHAAWLISQGQVPYRDYFDHHAPAFHALLAPAVALLEPETSFASAKSFLLLARGFAWLLAGGVLLLTFALARSWRGAGVAVVAAVLLETTLVHVRRTLEVRPDTLAVLLWVACLILARRALQRDATQRAPPGWSFLWSGVCLGAALLVTQKLVFGFLGVVLGLMAQPTAGWSGARRRDFLLLCAGMAAPLAVALTWLAAAGGLQGFFQDVLLFNLRFQQSAGGALLVLRLALEDPLLVTFGAAGVVRATRRIRAGAASATGDALLVGGLAGALAGVLT